MSRAAVLRVITAALILVLPSSALAVPRVVFDARTSCPTAKALKAALKAHANGARGTVHIRPTGDQQIAIRFVPAGKQPEQRRTIEVPGSCESVPDAIALLVESWSQLKLAEVPARTKSATSTQSTASASSQTAAAREDAETETVTRHSQDGDAVTLSSSNGETTVTVEVPPEPETPEVQPAQASVEPEPIPVQPEPTHLQPEPVEGATDARLDKLGVKEGAPAVKEEPLTVKEVGTELKPEPPLRSGFNLMLLGTGSTLFRHDGKFDPLVTAGAVRFEFPVFHNLGGAAQLRLEGSRVGAVANGNAETSVTGADLLVRYDFHSPGRSGPGLTAGVGLQRIIAIADGVGITSKGVQTVYDPELTATAEWHQVLDGGFFARVIAGTEIRTRTEVFGIELDGAFIGPTHVLYRTGWRAGLGLGWAF